MKVWNKAHELVMLVYQHTRSFPSDEKFGLTSQIRRAAVSVASNIVEGFRRNSFKVSKNFYEIADGSLEELRYQLFLSRDLDYIKLEEYQKTIRLSEEVSKMLHAWMKSQR